MSSPDPHAVPAAELLAWAADGPATDTDGSDGRPRLALVTGPRGAGKTRLLAGLVAATATPGSGATVHAVGFAQGQTAETLAWQLARHLGYGPLDPAPLLERLRLDPRPLLLLLTDLHRSGRGPAGLSAADPRTVITELVGPLLALPSVRAAVETDDPVALADLGGVDLDATLVVSVPPLPDAPTVPAPREPVADTLVPGQDWTLVAEEDREHALDHLPEAARALLTDPGYLVHGPVAAITAALADPDLPVPGRLREVWHRAAPALSVPGLSEADRAAVLHTAAVGLDGQLAEYLRPLAVSAGWYGRWTLRRPAAALAVSPVAATAVISGPLGRLTAHDLRDGAVIDLFGPTPLHAPAGLALFGLDTVLALDANGSIHPLGMPGAEEIPLDALRLTLHHNGAALLDPADRPTALGSTRRTAAVGDGKGQVHLWREDEEYPRVFRPHAAPVCSLAGLELPDGETVLLVAGALDGSIRLWDTATGGDPVLVEQRRTAVPLGLALAATPRGPVLAVSWSDQRLDLWHLLTGRALTIPALHRADSLALTANGTLVGAGTAGTWAVRLDVHALWPDD
ncbi:WD40 repeat domain-containing protein [Kitasatospora sp. NPDC004240]